ncbi:MAG: hypothetical protein PHZ26_02450 [Candidatus Gracilibacteria bacterium]|nr:hypothetical protein [Candidatus Gracilibacteria bacterium]MDD2908593.1 hypothetical protein [Candidatus Gracilibacteria bacterium]
MQFPKKRNGLTDKIQNLENYLFGHISKMILGFALFEISISLNREIKITLYNEEFNIYCTLHITMIFPDEKYYQKMGNIGINLKIRTNKNIILMLDNLDLNLKSIIIKNIVLVSKLEKTFISILNNNAK